MKIAINKQHGGFGLSPEATLWLWEKGCKSVEATHVNEYWPPEKRAEEDEKYKTMGYTANITQWREYLKGTKEGRNIFLSVFTPDEQYVLHARDVGRHDPLLLQVIEEMGDKASGNCATLKIVEIPDGVEYEIQEYDGMEWVAEKHRTWT